MDKKVFDAYEISPVHETESGTCEPQQSEADAKAVQEAEGGRVFWSLYGHIPGEGVVCLADRNSYSDIAELYHNITGCDAQEISGRYYAMPTGRN